MRNGAHTIIDEWSPTVGTKGLLQSGWFWVSGIPNDQRSTLTIAKVGALVGKTLEIDENYRYRYDYVRIKIACRDVTRVPKTAKATLGMCITDFGFEREIPEAKGDKILKSGIKVGDDQPPPSKRAKPNASPEKPNEEKSKDSDQHTAGSEKGYGKQVQYESCSAPPKIDFTRRSQTKLLADAQEAYNECKLAEEEGRVYIPEVYEEI
jgi:hypothetical protein